MKRFLMFVCAIAVLSFMAGSTMALAYHDQAFDPAKVLSQKERKFLSDKTEEAVRAHQGLFTIVLPQWNGPPATNSGNGVLIWDERHVLTMAHLLPSNPGATLHDTTQYFFNGIPAKYVASSHEMDLAFFELTSPIPGMRPAMLANAHTFGEIYYGIALYDSYALPLEYELISRSEKHLFAFRTGGQPGISGTPLWDSDGKLISIFASTSAGFAFAVHHEAIAYFLEQVVKEGKLSPVPKKSDGNTLAKPETPNAAEIIEKKVKTFGVILNLLAKQALNSSKDLAACADEMLGRERPKDSCFDKYSHWLPPVAAAENTADFKGEFGGIGMEIGIKDGKVVVISPIEDTPAAEGSVFPGDIIRTVDGEPVENPGNAKDRIRGKPGTTVTIGFTRGDKEFETTFTRRVITIHAVKAMMIAPTIGHLQIRSFTDKLVPDFVREWEELKKGGATAMVIDLRNNPGGYLHAALALLLRFAKPDDLFLTMRYRDNEIPIKEKEAAEMVQRFGKAEWLPKTVGEFRGIPVVLLINKGSASASEIVSGTMKDWGYTVDGEQSFGKGVGQTVYPLPDKSELLLTTFEFLVGNGKVKIHEIGVTPTHVVTGLDQKQFTDPREYFKTLMDPNKDPQLKKAIELLSQPQQ